MLSRKYLKNKTAKTKANKENRNIKSLTEWKFQACLRGTCSQNSSSLGVMSLPGGH